MKLPIWVVVVSLLFVALPGRAQTGIPSHRLGDNTGEDWEPAILVDGSHVYAFWPHYLATNLTDSSGATCMPFKGAGKHTTSSYMYFQSSNNGGSTWGPVSIPRCPVQGNNVDAQLALGANHRIYAGYMDGNTQYTPIEVIYSDDFGASWSPPVDVTNGGRGDKDIVLVDGNNNVMVAYENGGKQNVSVSTNGGLSFTSRQVNIAPNGVALATGGILDTRGNAYFSWVGTTNNGTGQSTFYVQSSSNLFSTYAVSTLDRSAGGPQVTGSGWDYWGGSIQIAVQPKTPNDRVIVIYNAGAGAAGAPERIYTKYSDTLGASWNIAFNASSWPNGSQVSLAPAGVWHGFPSIAANASSVKVIWMDNRASPGGNYTCQSSLTTGQCGIWNVYERSSADGMVWGAESVMTQPPPPPPYKTYQTAAGFDHPYGDYTEMVTDQSGNFYGIWAEGESKAGTGDVYFAKF